MMKKPVIFIVDKNPAQGNFIKYNLEIKRLYSVQVFSSGEECLYRMLKNVHPDFLVTSFFTDNLNGFEFLRKVREISPSIQVIFFDAFEDPQIAARLLDAGACDYVVKTNNPDGGISVLLKNLRYLLNKKALANV